MKLMNRPPVSRAHDEPPAGAVRLDCFVRADARLEAAIIAAFEQSVSVSDDGSSVDIENFSRKFSNILFFNTKSGTRFTVDILEVEKYIIRLSRREKNFGLRSSRNRDGAFYATEMLDRLIRSREIIIWGRHSDCLAAGELFPADMWPASSFEACEQGTLHFGERWLALPDGTKVYSLHLVKAPQLVKATEGANLPNTSAGENRLKKWLTEQISASPMEKALSRGEFLQKRLEFGCGKNRAELIWNQVLMSEPDAVQEAWRKRGRPSRKIT
jgi:hypothetical protein